MIYKNKKQVLVIGDSHIRVFEHIFFKIFLAKYNFNVVYVAGATAYGIGNKNSKTNSYNVFLNALKTSDYEQIIISLGEVDTAYTLWSIAQRDKKEIKDIILLATQRYKQFLKEISVYAPVIVFSASLPTISDLAQCDGSVAGIRKNIKVSQKRRTYFTLFFNKKVRDFCRYVKPLTYIDFSPNTLNSKKRYVNHWILNKDLCDHHYSRWVYAGLIILKKYKKEW